MEKFAESLFFSLVCIGGDALVAYSTIITALATGTAIAKNGSCYADKAVVLTLTSI
jgi:hypothetical protein